MPARNGWATAMCRNRNGAAWHRALRPVCRRRGGGSGLGGLGNRALSRGLSEQDSSGRGRDPLGAFSRGDAVTGERFEAHSPASGGGDRRVRSICANERRGIGSSRNPGSRESLPRRWTRGASAYAVSNTRRPRLRASAAERRLLQVAPRLRAASMFVRGCMRHLRSEITERRGARHLRRRAFQRPRSRSADLGRYKKTRPLPPP